MIGNTHARVPEVPSLLPVNVVVETVTDRRYGAIPGSAYWRHRMIGA